MSLFNCLSIPYDVIRANAPIYHYAWRLPETACVTDIAVCTLQPTDIITKLRNESNIIYCVFQLEESIGGAYRHFQGHLISNCEINTKWFRTLFYGKKARVNLYIKRAKSEIGSIMYAIKDRDSISNVFELADGVFRVIARKKAIGIMEVFKAGQGCE